MTRTTALVLLWAPRAIGILIALFLALFALDSFAPGRSFASSLPDFAIHLLPAGAVLLVVALSWQREWLGALACLLLAAAYVGMVRGRWDWVLVISGPLTLAGLVFLVSWLYHESIRTTLGTTRP